MAFKMKGFSAFTKNEETNKPKRGNIFTKVRARIKNYITRKKLEGFEAARSEKLGYPYVPASKKNK
tara:strand:+ start:192 stop:389 length:198 start_codon:yes stop_codon:yes gene_type:complete